MTLLSDCILRKRPFDLDVFRPMKRRGQREHEFLRKDHWELIASVKADGHFERTVENETAIRELVTSRAVLQYLNDEVWYRVNPYVEDLA